MKGPPQKRRIMQVPKIKNKVMTTVTLEMSIPHFIPVGMFIAFKGGGRSSESAGVVLAFWPNPPIPESMNLVLRALYGVNWQRAVLSDSGEVIVFQLSSANSGYSITSPRERREVLRPLASGPTPSCGLA